MVLYQLLTAQAPFSDEEHSRMPYAALVHAIVHDNLRPKLEQVEGTDSAESDHTLEGSSDSSCVTTQACSFPKSILALYEECSSAAGQDRPPFTEVVARLERRQKYATFLPRFSAWNHFDV